MCSTTPRNAGNTTSMARTGSRRKHSEMQVGQPTVHTAAQEDSKVLTSVSSNKAAEGSPASSSNCSEAAAGAARAAAVSVDSQTVMAHALMPTQGLR